MYKKNRSLLLAVIISVSPSLLYGCRGNERIEAPTRAPKVESTVEMDVRVDETGNGSMDYGPPKPTIGSTGAADDISTQAMTYMEEHVEEKSSRVIVMNALLSLQLGAAVDQLEMTGQGPTDLLLEADLMTNNGVIEVRVGSLTFTCTPEENCRKVSESEPYEGWKNKFCKPNNIKVVTNNWYRNGTALVSDREIHTAEDMKGLKVRIPQMDITMESFSEIGTDPTPIAYNGSLLTLQQGVVEAIWCTEDAAYATGFYEVTQYLIELNSYFDSMYMYMNNDLYNSITDVRRDLIMEATLEARKYYSELVDEALMISVVKMKESGIEMISLPPEEVVKSQTPMEAMADKYEVAGEWPVGTYDEILEILGK